MRRALSVLSLAGALAGAASAQPVVSAVLNGASYSAVVSPGCWVSIFGTNLATASATAPAVPLPPTLGGVSVSVGSVSAPLLYVSPTQIDALIPAEVTIPANTVVPVAVTSSGGSVTHNIRLTRNAPAIFTRNGLGTGRALVFDAFFRVVDTLEPFDPTTAYPFILYATGLGPTTTSGGLNPVVDPVEVYIGERKADVLFAGLAPGIPGVYQLNFWAPPAPATDRVYVRSGGWQSNITDIGIRAGANTANVKGTIDGLFPSSDPGFPATAQRPCAGDNDPGPCGPTGESFSVLLHAGSFSVSFDILPSAGPFDVAAVGEAGGTVITINPAAGTYTASVTTPTVASTRGDFSSSISTLWDYASCDWKSAVCLPFPNNIFPFSRMSPYWARAVQMLPAPSTSSPASPNASLQASGAVSGARFAVDSQNNSALSKFGGTVQVPYGPFPARVSTFKLYVDGKLIASKDLPYAVLYRALGPHFPDF